MAMLDDLRVEAPDTATAKAAKASTTDAAAGTAAVPTSPTAVEAQAAFGSTRDAGVNAAESVGYNAQTGEIDPSQMTAAGQLTNITSKDSPLMRRAAQMGLLEAGRRGLENSSFAAGAATGQMVDKATPLAQQDAATYFQNMRANLEAVNRAREVSSGRANDVGLANAQMRQQVELANANAANQMSELNAQLQTAVSQQNADAANRIRQQMAEIEAQINQRNAELETQTNLANAEAANRTSMFNAEQKTNVSLQNAAQRNAMETEVFRTNAELNRQYLAGEQAVDLENIRGRYNQIISSNQSAAQIYDSYLSGISAIMQNKDIEPSRVAQYINVMAKQLEGSLEFIDAINALDLGSEVTTPTGATSTGGNIYPDTGEPQIASPPGNYPGYGSYANWY